MSKGVFLLSNSFAAFCSKFVLVLYCGISKSADYWQNALNTLVAHSHLNSVFLHVLVSVSTNILSKINQKGI